MSTKEKRKLDKLDPAKSVASQVEAKLMKQIEILQDALGEQQRSNAKWEAKMNSLVKSIEAKKSPGATAPSAKKKKKGAPTPPTPSQQQRSPSPHQDVSSVARQQRNQNTHQAQPEQQQSRRNRAALRTQQRVQGRDLNQQRANWVPPQGNP
jgi:hypothetical protein